MLLSSDLLVPRFAATLTRGGQPNKPNDRERQMTTSRKSPVLAFGKGSIVLMTLARIGRQVLTVALVAAVTGSVGAVQPRDVVIQAHTELGCPGPASCVFVASGAIVDGGTVTTDSVHATALPSPVVGTAHYVKTFHGLAGTLTIQLNSMITATNDPALWDEKGNWVIVSG